MMDMTLCPLLRAISWASSTILEACCSNSALPGGDFLSFSYCQLKNRMANFSSCCLKNPIWHISEFERLPRRLTL